MEEIKKSRQEVESEVIRHLEEIRDLVNQNIPGANHICLSIINDHVSAFCIPDHEPDEDFEYLLYADNHSDCGGSDEEGGGSDE